MRSSTRYILSALLLLLPMSLTEAFTQVSPSSSSLSFHRSILLASPQGNVEESSSKVAHNTRTPVKPDTNKDDNVVPLPPVLQSIADERMEYQMNVGKAMDVLRHDYQYIFSQKLDFSIYDQAISLIDPSGQKLTGLEKYKSAFAFFQGFLGFWFHTTTTQQQQQQQQDGSVSLHRQKKSGIQFRMVYDFARCSIRISWNAVLIPKIPGIMRPLHIDGISYYQLDRQSGQIVEHKIENLLINNTPVQPPYSILQLMQQDMMRTRPQGVAAGVGAISSGCEC